MHIPRMVIYTGWIGGGGGGGEVLYNLVGDSLFA